MSLRESGVAAPLASDLDTHFKQILLLNSDVISFYTSEKKKINAAFELRVKVLILIKEK